MSTALLCLSTSAGCNLLMWEGIYFFFLLQVKKLPELDCFFFPHEEKKQILPVEPWGGEGGCREHLLPFESSTSSAVVWFLEACWACEVTRLIIRGLGSVNAFPCTFRECSFSWLIVMVENEQEEHLYACSPVWAKQQASHQLTGQQEGEKSRQVRKEAREGDNFSSNGIGNGF